jgi:hypothetical protein
MDWRQVYSAAGNNDVEELARLENEGYSLSLADPVGGCRLAQFYTSINS